jgi:O-antigen/teichoic acid export membrane protein
MVDPPDRLRHSLGSQVAALSLKLVVSIGIGGWMSRYLGPNDLGKLSYASALVGLLAPLGSLGVQGSLSALLCQEKPAPGLVPTAFLIEIIGTLIIALVLLPVAFFSRDRVIATLISISILGNLFSSVEIFETELLILQRGTLLARIGLFQTLTNALLTSGAILLRAPLIGFAWLQVVQSALRALFLATLRPCRQSLKQFRQIYLSTAMQLIERGLPLLIAGLSVALYMKSDQVMLQWLKGSEAVGQYSVAARMSETLYFLPVILANTLFSRIGKATSVITTAMEVKRLYRHSWLLGFGMMFVNIGLLPFTIPIIFGSEFKPSQLTLALMGPAAFAVSTGCASSAWLQLRKQEWISTARTATGALINVMLNFTLIPTFGASGAAMATSISYLVATFALTMAFNKETRENTLLLLNPF